MRTATVELAGKRVSRLASSGSRLAGLEDAMETTTYYVAVASYVVGIPTRGNF